MGRSRDGRTTKIHALTDRCCRPLAFLPTCGQSADCTAGALLLQCLLACRIMLADKGYDSDAIRRQIDAAGAAPNIPAQGQSALQAIFLPRALSRAQRHRADVRPPQGLPSYRHEL
ncbi:transposase [Methylobacterium longum]|uniref:transposase n=1 Tax=Methylobacterium longum TaxID=767694 RepID=UPI003570ED59